MYIWNRYKYIYTHTLDCGSSSQMGCKDGGTQIGQKKSRIHRTWQVVLTLLW